MLLSRNQNLHLLQLKLRLNKNKFNMLKRARILGKKLKKSKRIRRKILNLLGLRKLGKLM
jgi:hypothetical protein